MREAIQEITATLAAILTILENKGVMTADEFKSWRAKAIAELDQAMAGAREEYFTKHPEMRLLHAIFGDEQ